MRETMRETGAAHEMVQENEIDMQNGAKDKMASKTMRKSKASTQNGARNKSGTQNSAKKQSQHAKRCKK